MQTFLVYRNFRLSARCLDRLRLNKQCLEGQQLIDLIEDYYLIANYFAIGMPVDPSQWRNWCQSLVTQYHALPIRLLRCYSTGQVVVVGEDTGAAIRQKDLPKDWHLVALTSNHRNHPALIMWLGHVEALKEYVMAHIEEWIGRGGRAEGYRRYQINSATITYPSWLEQDYFYLCHRSILLAKELAAKASGNKRKYPGPCYELQADFLNAPSGLKYHWPY